MVVSRYMVSLVASANFWKKVRDLVRIGTGGGLVFCAIGLNQNDPVLHKYITIPIMHRLDPETSHRLSIWALKHKLIAKPTRTVDPILHNTVMGLPLCSPIGLAAGYDKDGEAVPGLYRLGFGAVEVGSVTPLPQPGNDKPRVFRLEEDGAVINRYGFNSVGHAAVAANLAPLPPPGQRAAPLGINLGKNKTSPDAQLDYRAGVRSLGPLADYLVINVSSPNTPGLRGLQDGGVLGDLVEGVQEEMRALAPHTPPLLVKIAPDLSEEEIREICLVLKEKKVSGVIVSNTTVSRPPSLRSAHAGEGGGLSGRPLEELSTWAVRVAKQAVGDSMVVIGSGGVSSAAGAYAKLRAGASVVQLYTALVYEGPGLPRAMEGELAQLIRDDGFNNISEVIGADLKQDSQSLPLR